VGETCTRVPGGVIRVLLDAGRGSVRSRRRRKRVLLPLGLIGMNGWIGLLAPHADEQILAAD